MNEINGSCKGFKYSVSAAQSPLSETTAHNGGGTDDKKAHRSFIYRYGVGRQSVFSYEYQGYMVTLLTSIQV